MGSDSTKAGLSEEAKHEKEKLFKALPMLFGAAVLVMAVTFGLFLSGTVKANGQTKSLPDFQSRVQFVFKNATLPLFFIPILLFYVVFNRILKSAANPLLRETEMLVKEQQNILQNTLEQVLISLFGQLLLVSFLEDEEWILRIIPCVNILLVLGRITFWMGYPVKRTFGFALGIWPSFAMYCFVTYKYFEHLFC